MKKELELVIFLRSELNLDFASNRTLGTIEHKITLAVAHMLTENDIDRLIPCIGDCAVFKANWKYLKVTRTNEQEEQLESDKLSEETSITCFYEEENMKKKELSSLKVPFEERNSNLSREKENEHLEFDFASAYPEYTNSLFNNFPLIKIKIISLVKAWKKDSFLCYLETLFENSEEISNIATFLALAHLHGTTTIPYRLPGIRKTKRWRPSKQEVREGFIAHVTSATEVSEVIDIVFSRSCDLVLFENSKMCPIRRGGADADGDEIHVRIFFK
ncbi:hypothetical protein EVAR_57008_1 [Eumeta japonica]|uniref:Uncharacterized protein n=1 Tax=Eumeta variegata TaxID=151549 RepID=A0A4C1ZM00_EUMVA|nr:hypothetical protein EVAR_57008_1 [Eumeta japonica]